jgi:hypothetical protein
MNWNEFNSLMRRIADEVADIQFLTVGNNLEVAEAVKSERRYPAMHVSFPQVRSQFNGNGLKETWNIQISVGESIPVGDNVAMDNCHDKTLRLLRKVLAKIVSLSDEYGYELGQNINIDVIDPRTSDNENGWFADFDLEFVNCFIY